MGASNAERAERVRALAAKRRAGTVGPGPAQSAWGSERDVADSLRSAREAIQGVAGDLQRLRDRAGSLVEKKSGE